MGDYSPGELMTMLGSGVATLTAASVAARKYFRSERVAEAQTRTMLGGQRAGDIVVENLVKEVARLTAQMAEMRTELDELKDELDYVRSAGVEGLELAMACTCKGVGRETLIDHLKAIIKGPPKKAANEYS